MIMEFISYAFADTANQYGTASSLLSFVPLTAIFIIFYFFVIRPQSQKVKTHNKMIEELEAGDKVVTSGGIIGVVIKVDKKNSTFHLEICDGVIVKLAKNFISERISKKNDTSKR